MYLKFNKKGLTARALLGLAGAIGATLAIADPARCRGQWFSGPASMDVQLNCDHSSYYSNGAYLPGVQAVGCLCDSASALTASQYQYRTQCTYKTVFAGIVNAGAAISKALWHSSPICKRIDSNAIPVLESSTLDVEDSTLDEEE